jgi:hypothetical protein
MCILRGLASCVLPTIQPFRLLVTVLAVVVKKWNSITFLFS